METPPDPWLPESNAPPIIAQPPTVGRQILSAVTSFVIRCAALSYTVYLAMLFTDRFAEAKAAAKSVHINSREIAMFVGLTAALTCFVFRKVYADRLTPVAAMLKRFLARLLKIVLVFIFWTFIFNTFPDLGANQFALVVATILIVNSGYDFRLSARPRPTNLSPGP